MDSLLLGLLLGFCAGVSLSTWVLRRRRRRLHGLRRRIDYLQKEARSEERQRLMRDIHDGVGAQLTGMLQLVERPQWPRALLAEQVQLAVDELRLAVDALQPEGGELGLLLAQLRHRLRPRLQAAGLRVHWELPELPRWQLGSAAALNLQRLLIEAFTNVLKHAQAQEVRLEAGVADEQLILRLCDDGIGLSVSSTGAGPGVGLASMQARALKLGAELELLPVHPQGLCVCLRLPLAPVGVPGMPTAPG